MCGPRPGSPLVHVSISPFHTHTVSLSPTIVPLVTHALPAMILSDDVTRRFHPLVNVTVAPQYICPLPIRDQFEPSTSAPRFIVITTPQ